MSFAKLTDTEILSDLGERIRRYRLQQNVTQEHLAQSAGIATRTLRNLESGGDVQLSTVIRILRALGRLDALDSFLPRPKVSPMELLRSGGTQRKRARGSRDG